MTNELDTWDGFTGDWLVSKEVNPDHAYIIKGINFEKDKNGDERPHLVLEREGVTKKVNINQTNSKIAQSMGFTTPKDMIGAAVYFRPKESSMGWGVEITNLVKKK